LQSQPWATGPAEILRHGLQLLEKDSDTNRRLALISIDNAVELMIKTYLGLPRRVTGIAISRAKFAEISESFPRLLDALEEHGSGKLTGINLGEIEWYHRLRNELYHQGNGLTVERDKVEIYSTLAKLLFANLFGIELIPHETGPDERLGEFMKRWLELERRLHSLVVTHGAKPYPRALTDAMRRLRLDGSLSAKDLAAFEELRCFRNELVHGQLDVQRDLSRGRIATLRALLDKLPPDPAA